MAFLFVCNILLYIGQRKDGHVKEELANKNGSIVLGSSATT